MWVRSEPSSRMQLISEVLQLFYGKTAFQKRPCINPRRGVTLKINNIAFLIFSPCPKKVIEANLIQCRGRGIGRNMPPNAFLQTVGSYDQTQTIQTKIIFVPRSGFREREVVLQPEWY